MSEMIIRRMETRVHVVVIIILNILEISELFMSLLNEGVIEFFKWHRIIVVRENIMITRNALPNFAGIVQTFEVAVTVNVVVVTLVVFGLRNSIIILELRRLLLLLLLKELIPGETLDVIGVIMVRRIICVLELRIIKNRGVMQEKLLLDFVVLIWENSSCSGAD